ncbi:hypothetical protein MAFF301069_03820 [Ralstonia pseudosolanacearum]|nr:hypothetical protein MAFF211479_03550 [Ralstonia solanacearum]BEU45010.1 hypothetical protein MAFF211519_03350 [Ralstonia pseudosolanacearum]BCL95902.1 hypothetical protein MAFF211491_03540 [Ralstonia solanacearum]BCM00970.1 hypothetical protein MAFF301560_03570 [Ralstonia solanacearum]BCM05975.1 hypothetical protein MAFF241647_03320 [Ralstonia solanacearum]
MAALCSARAFGDRPDGMPSTFGAAEPAGFDGRTSDWAITLAENTLDNATNNAVFKILEFNTEALLNGDAPI